MRCGQTWTGLCLIVALTCALAPVRAQADDRAQTKFLRFEANPTFGPIGKVALNTLGGNSLLINGRVAHHDQVVWNGDLVQVNGDASARILLDSLGQLTLRKGAQARLATTASKIDGNVTLRVLILTLNNGNLAVDLQQDAVAYIEAGESVFSTTLGAQFRIGVLEGRAVVETARGEVTIEQQRQVRIKPRDVDVRPDGTIVVVANAQPLKTKAGKKPKDRLQWMKSVVASGGQTFTLVAFSNSAGGAQTVPDDEPVRGRLVTFETEPAGLATIQPATTDARGIVTYTFRARKEGSGKIKATIEHDPQDPPQDTVYDTYYRDFIIDKPGFWRLRNKILIAIAAGAVISITCCLPKGPIKQQPPPTIP